jgi:hypothetical protein
VRAIVAQRVMPGFLDRYLAKNAWTSQVTDRLPPGHPHRHAKDNVFETLPGDRGAHGPFDARARAFSAFAWSQRHARWLGLAAAAAVGIAALAIGVSRRRA